MSCLSRVGCLYTSHYPRPFVCRCSGLDEGTVAEGGGGCPTSAIATLTEGGWRLVRLNTPQEGEGGGIIRLESGLGDGTRRGLLASRYRVSRRKRSPLGLKRSATSQSHSGGVVQRLIQLPNLL